VETTGPSGGPLADDVAPPDAAPSPVAPLPIQRRRAAEKKPPLSFNVSLTLNNNNKEEMKPTLWSRKRRQLIDHPQRTADQDLLSSRDGFLQKWFQHMTARAVLRRINALPHSKVNNQCCYGQLMQMSAILTTLRLP